MLLLAVSGSLRAASSNTAALQALCLLAPPELEIALYDVGRLPHFNPDLDVEPLPAPVRELRALVGRCAGIVISSPEYAHGMPGSLKNALDWLVSSFEFPGKPVALVNTSPRAVHAQAALTETLTTMSARLVPEANVTLPLLGRTLDAAGIAADAELAALLRRALDAFERACAA
ncbi:MAG: NAD(P)H-dependent oxidoreductase [Nevskia sp.]|nr:NAD(P)H-dependent oxidoreductase [Nevskia sp.]